MNLSAPDTRSAKQAALAAVAATPKLRELSILLGDGPVLTCHQQHPAPTTEGRQTLSTGVVAMAVQAAQPLGLSALRLCGSAGRVALAATALRQTIETGAVAIRAEINSQGITPRAVQNLAQISRCKVFIGLQGVNAKTHPDRDAGENFQETCDAITQLSQAGLDVQIVFTLQAGNIHHIETAIGLAKSLGAESIRFRFAQPHAAQDGQAKPVSRQLTVEELIAIGRKLERRKRSAGAPRVLFDQPPAFRGLQREVVVDGGERCDLLQSLTVLASGEYALCALGQDEPALRLGRVDEIDLAELWRAHPILHRLRSGLPGALQGVCGRCTLRTSCLGNCAANNLLCTGSFFGADWFCASAARSGLFPASRLEENNW